MKYLVISDTHLSRLFNPRKFKKLLGLINSVDRVIINGDFFEGYTWTFEEFVNSKWKDLFPALKSKHTIYINGNHDPKDLINEKYKLFADQMVNEFTIETKNSNYVVRHGHEITPTFDMLHPRIRKSLIFPFLIYLNEFFQYLIIKLFKFFRHDFLQFAWGSDSIQQLNWKLKNGQNKVFYIMSHTHAQFEDQKNKFINTGIFTYGIAQYAIIDEHGIKIFNETY